MTATSDWISDSLLASLMLDSLSTRNVGDPLKVDSLLYSNNSIFGLIPKTSTMRGRMIVNGALLAADIGLLVPGNQGGVGLNLNYDPRVADMIAQDSPEEITIREELWIGAISY